MVIGAIFFVAYFYNIWPIFRFDLLLCYNQY